jgi:hypothetical protein
MLMKDRGFKAAEIISNIVDIISVPVQIIGILVLLLGTLFVLARITLTVT